MKNNDFALTKYQSQNTFHPKINLSNNKSATAIEKLNSSTLLQ